MLNGSAASRNTQRGELAFAELCCLGFRSDILHITGDCILDKFAGRAAPPYECLSPCYFSRLQPASVRPSMSAVNSTLPHLRANKDRAWLDYRTDPNVKIRVLKEPLSEAIGLLHLAERLGQTFGAADFKTCPDTGRLLFLEFNSMPMFAAFDRAAGGVLSGMIIDWLTASVPA